MLTHFNLQAFRELHNNICRSPSGFRYGFVSGILHKNAYSRLIAEFPDTGRFVLVDKQSGGGRKRFYVGPHYASVKDYGCVCHLRRMSALWKEVMRESASAAFIGLLSAATGVRCNSLCNFGFTYGNEGCMQETHIDGAVRADDPSLIKSTIACFLYCNADGGGVSGTRLYGTDRTTVLFEVPDMYNSLFFFEQHPDAWHGFPAVPHGVSRRLVSIAYSFEKSPIELREGLFHTAFCFTHWRASVRIPKIRY